MNIQRLLFITGIAFFSLPSFGDIANTESFRVNNKPLDVEFLSSQKPETVSDSIESARAKLEEKGRETFKKNMAESRLEHEKSLLNKVESSFSAGNLSSNQEKTTVVIEDKKVVEVIESPKLVSKRKRSSIRLSTGTTSFQEDYLDFKSSFAGEVSVESQVGRYLSVGLSFGLVKMSIYDGPNRYSRYGRVSPYLNRYRSVYGSNGREVTYSGKKFDAFGKLFLSSPLAKIRPYIGGSLAYNRDSFEYKLQSHHSFNSRYNYGGEGYDSSYFSTSGILGVEMQLRKNLALLVDFKYSKVLFDSSKKGSRRDTFLYRDQKRLENISEAIESSDQLSILGGISFKF